MSENFNVVVYREATDCDGKHTRTVEYSAKDFRDTVLDTIAREIGHAALTGRNIHSNYNWDGYGDGWKEGNVQFGTEEGYVFLEWHPETV